jgi:hypothetical protein
MHATVVRVTISDPAAAEGKLREEVVPAVSQTPGFVAGYWTREGDEGLSMVVYDSEAGARAAADRVPQMLPHGVALESVEVRTVVASA